MNRPKAIDLFAGAGGMSLGFEQAGYDVVAAVEVDPVHAATHKFNFPDCCIFPTSVTKISGRELLDGLGLKFGEIDVVFGGAPCQGFSLIGQRALEDPRNALVKDFVRLVAELGSNYFVFENVKGLTVGKHKQFLRELVEEFEHGGYDVLLPWQVLNSFEFSVPQDRNRLFLIGAKKGLPLPGYPKRKTCSPRTTPVEGTVSAPTCKDALGDLPDIDTFKELLESDEVEVVDWRDVSRYAAELRCISNDAWHFGHFRTWDPGLLTSSARTNHTEISRRRFAETRQGTVEPISRFFKLSENGVSNTLRAGTDSARGAFTSPRPVHFKQDRCISVREMARLHGYPDWFRFHVTKWHGARQVGNSVPPPLARAVAQSVMKASGIAPCLSFKQYGPQDKRLLQMDITKASRYWGIDIPIKKRDRKSGAKKRRQEDIELDRLLAKAV